MTAKASIQTLLVNIMAYTESQLCANDTSQVLGTLRTKKLAEMKRTDRQPM